MTTQQIKELLSKQFDTAISSIELNPVGGGSINDTYKATINRDTKLFLKLNSSLSFPLLFEKEKKGLEFLAKQKCIHIPSVICYEEYDNYQFLLLEWIESGIHDENFWKKFGEQLAQLHSITQEKFGFAEDNYMGSLPQANDLTKNWTDFFINFRLQPQIELAGRKDHLKKSHVHSFGALFKNLDSIFSNENPSLLHGDLWSGNFMCNDQSLPVLIDPAIYFGHRSVDLAMTTLFGGFDKTFYDAYHYHSPLPANYREQWELCNLYPLLIHLNLFGKGYLPDIINTVKKFT